MDLAVDSGVEMNLDELLQMASMPELCGETPVVESVTCDSRRVIADSLFVVIEGRSLDGGEFVADAISKGACAIAAKRRPREMGGLSFVKIDNPRKDYARLCAAHAGFPMAELDVIGVTGTNGKTTSTMMIEQMLKSAGRLPGLIGTIGNHVGVRQEEAKMTTPSPEDLYPLLREMRESGLDSVALEVSSHALDQDRLHGKGLTVAAFTTMARDHLDYHQTVEAYHQTKSRLLEHLCSGGSAVLNADAPECEKLQALVPIGCKALRYSLSGKPAEVRGEIISMDLTGMKMKIRVADESICCTTRIVGAHNAANILLACASVHALGVPLSAVAQGVEALAHIEGRFEVLDLNVDFDVLIDYAHSPDAFESTLGTLRALTRGRLLVLFGCGGAKDKGKRPEMGRIAEYLSDMVFLTDDNPRQENPDKIVMDIKAGMDEPQCVTYLPDRREAILHVLEVAQSGDVVLLAGKGHEKCQVIGEQIVAHSDRAVVDDWIAWRDGKQGKAP